MAQSLVAYASIGGTPCSVYEEITEVISTKFPTMSKSVNLLSQYTASL